MMTHLGKIQANSIKDVAGVAGTRYESTRAITSSKMAEKYKSETTCTSSYDKKAIYKISNQSDERRKRSCRDKIGWTERPTEGWTNDRSTHRRSRVISIVPLRLCRVHSYTKEFLLQELIFFQKGDNFCHI